ncbi:hypothetical protein Bca52824_020433 [Brassica carinata]|uniref:Uncharacterized protein n=1 Tax=Brassica carinata TaxID=52824 RepID=A0A8X7VTC9_BRACI|nr:hypothetical protein Bca52824_020433 [Brassica carinata]
MDSTNPLNPYSDSPSYSYLLHSQNFQYGSYPSSQNFGEGSEIPPFSSQQPDAPASQECSQTSSTTIGDQEVRPEGSKAAKARRNNTQGIKSIAEYTTVMELKKEDLMMKERLSKLAILDTLLAKPGPLSLFKMGRYSYSQPSDSSEYGGEISEPYEYSETEDLIRRDQEDLSLKYGDTAQYPPQYPPQPEIEFGFPQVCYCGGAPKIATSYTWLDPGRRYYTCEHFQA